MTTGRGRGDGNDGMNIEVQWIFFGVMDEQQEMKAWVKWGCWGCDKIVFFRQRTSHDEGY